MKFILPFLFAFSLFGDSILVNYRQLTNAIATNNTALAAAPRIESFDSIATLIASGTTNLPGNTIANVKGYYSSTAGLGGGFFSFIPAGLVPSDVTGTNYGTLLVPADNPTYRWLRVRRDNLSVYDFGAKCDGSDDHNAFQNAVVNTKNLTLPAGATMFCGYAYTNTIYIQSGINLHISGSITGHDNFTFLGAAILDGGGTINTTYNNDPAELKFIGSANDDVVIHDIRIIGSGLGYGVLITKDVALNNLHVYNNYFENHLSAFLRQTYIVNTLNTNTYVKLPNIHHNTLVNINGDGINWESALYDGPLDINDNKLKTVNASYSPGTGFFGFPIAVAGWSYNTWPTTLAHKKITINRNTIDYARIGIHVEYANDVAINNNTFYAITDSLLNTGTNIFSGEGTTAIEVAGVNRLSIIGNASTSMSITNRPTGKAYGAYVSLGFESGNFTSSPDNVYIADNFFQGGGIFIAGAANVTNYLSVPNFTVKGNTVLDGTFDAYGQGQFSVDNNYVRAPWGNTAFTYDFASRLGPNTYGGFLNYLKFKNNTFINPVGSSSVSISSLEDTSSESNIIVEAVGNNFSFNSPSYKASSVPKVYISTNGIPYGPTFNVNDVVVDTSQSPPRIITIASAGSRSYPGDYIGAQPATNAVKGFIQSAVVPWSVTTIHHPGQLVQFTVTNSVAHTNGAVHAVIQRIYNDGPTSAYVAVLLNPTTGLPIDLTNLTPTGQMFAETEVGYLLEPTAAITIDLANIAAGTGLLTSGLSVPGARLGDTVNVSYSGNALGLIFYACVTASDTVSLSAFNPTGGGIDLASGTFKFTTRTVK